MKKEFLCEYFGNLLYLYNYPVMAMTYIHLCSKVSRQIDTFTIYS